MAWLPISDEDLEAMEILSKRDDLTQWEETFLEDMADRIRLGGTTWTEKQKAAFDKMWTEKMGA